MEPTKLLEALMSRESLNSHSLAKKLKGKPSQPQIYKFLKKVAKEPKRDTLRPIAEHFGVELEAFYNPEMAASEAHRLGLTVLTAAPAPTADREIPAQYASLVDDLDDIPPARRSKLLDHIHELAEEAREAAAHHASKAKTKAAAQASRRRAVASMTYGDGNKKQASLPLKTVADPFSAAPGERESALYKKFDKSPKE